MSKSTNIIVKVGQFCIVAFVCWSAFLGLYSLGNFLDKEEAIAYSCKNIMVVSQLNESDIEYDSYLKLCKTRISKNYDSLETKEEKSLYVDYLECIRRVKKDSEIDSCQKIYYLRLAELE